MRYLFLETKALTWTPVGDVFDVTHKADSHGQGNSYNVFAGKGGSRILKKSGIEVEYAVADYRVLSDKERKMLEDRHAFSCVSLCLRFCSPGC